MNQITKANPKYIALNTQAGIKVVEVSKIIYLEATGRYTKIHLQNKVSVTVCKNLGHYENLFKNLDFLRTHNSFLINVAYLSDIVKDGGGQYCVLGDDSFIAPISNRKFTNIKEYLYY